MPGIVQKALGFFRNERDSVKKSVILGLSRIFSVTSIDPVSARGSKATIIKLKPEKDLSQILGSSKEILCFYFDYKTIEPRVFQVIEDIFRRDLNEIRVEQLFCLVTSQAENFLKTVDQYKIENSTGRTIVPLPIPLFAVGATFDENILLEQFQKYLYVKNLFEYSNPIADEQFFFGRNEVVLKINQLLSSGHNVGLFGLRKIGKTSILFKLQRLSDLTQESIYKFISLEDPRLYQLSWRELLGVVLYECFGVKPPAGAELEQFEIEIKRRSKQPNAKRLIIAFNEIEHISPLIAPESNWKDGDDFLHFWKYLRVMQQRFPSHLSFIVVGVNASVVERAVFSNFDNPLYNLLNIIYLKPMLQEEISEMVSVLSMPMGIQVDPEVITESFEEFGGHPLLTRLSFAALADLVKGERRPIKISLKHYRKHSSSIGVKLKLRAGQILWVLERYYPSEYDMLKLLSRASVEDIDAFLREHSNELAHIIDYGLFDESQKNIKIKFISDYLAQDLNRNIDEESIELWKELNAIRNRLEPNLRKFVRQIFISRLGRERWFDPIWKILNEQQKDKLKVIDKDIILNEKLYLLDFITVILSNWDVFNILEKADKKVSLKKTHFEILANYVNAHREDAHAGEISQAEINAVALAAKSIYNAISGYI